MADLSIMERQLQVLTRIEERLAQIEAKLDTPVQPTVKIDESVDEGGVSPSLKKKIQEFEASAIGTGNEESSSEENSDADSAGLVELTEEERAKAGRTYIDAKFADFYDDPDDLPTLDPEGDTDPKELWTKYLGPMMWSLPPDGRLVLSFQRHMLERMSQADNVQRLEIVQSWFLAMGEGNVLIQDFDMDGRTIDYRLPIEGDSTVSLEEKLREDRLSGWPNMFHFAPFEDKQPKIQQEFGGQNISAPWCRFITLKGLSSSGFDTSRMYFYNRDYDPNYDPPPPHYIIHREVPFFAGTTTGEIASLFHRFLSHHLFLHQPQAEVSQWVEEGNLVATSFHLSHYMMLYTIGPENSEELKLETWNNGFLYNKITRFTHAEYNTILIFGKDANVPSRQKNGCGSTTNARNPWTIVHLRPKYETYRPSAPSEPELFSEGGFQPRNAAEAFLEVIHFSILDTADSWSALVRHFDSLLDEGNIFMDPAAHDNLLVDDEAFSRSRKYFWALSCLVIFRASLEDNINQWETSRVTWEREFADAKKWAGAQGKMQEIEVSVDKLRLYLKVFKDHHERVSALRDGLFNASSVMESRDANKLGENVKLLTFVSIFFLPLAFCTSLWSMNNDLFSMTALIYVIIFVASATYFVVFNLNSIVRLSGLAYNKQRSKLLSEMTEEQSIYWRDKGADFARFSFKPQAKSKQPSEWLISLYFLKRIPGRVLETLKRTRSQQRKKDDEAGE